MYDFFQICYITKKINKAIFCFGFWALGCTKKTKKIKKWPLGKLGALRKNKFLKIYIFREFLVLKAKCLCNFWPFFFWSLYGPKNGPKMVLGKLIDHFKNYFLLRYNIYDFLKQISGCLWPTRLVRTHCALLGLGAGLESSQTGVLC